MTTAPAASVDFDFAPATDEERSVYARELNDAWVEAYQGWGHTHEPDAAEELEDLMADIEDVAARLYGGMDDLCAWASRHPRTPPETHRAAQTSGG